MSLNQDGLVPGQTVDFETLKKVERLRRAAVVECEIEQPAKPKRKAKNETVQQTK